jgi:hypothetical protein
MCARCKALCKKTRFHYGFVTNFSRRRCEVQTLLSGAAAAWQLTALAQQQPMPVVNLKTAKSLGLTVPLPLLGRADKIIE